MMTRISKLLYKQDPNFGIDAENIGGGMVVYHGNASIVFAKSIGKNFCVYQQVTIGRGKCIDGNDLPIIGDNVNIYAGAIVVGGIRIGNNVSIGAGAVVVKDVPDNTTVVSAPVRMLSKN
jgi:serine O-acetyltransferase